MGHRSRQYIARTTILLILLTGWILPATFTPPAYAAVEDIEIDINDAEVYRNLDTSGDMLFVLHYEISWDDEDDYPDDPADDNTLIQLLAVDKSATLAATVPYPYSNSGYSEAVASFYFSPVQVTALSLTWDTAYILRVTTEPGFLATAVYDDWTLSGSDYIDSSDQDDNQAELGEWIMDVATDLETDWGVSTGLTTVTVDDMLSESGEQYFGRVIPGLRDLCPGIFQAIWGTLSYDEKDYDQSMKDTLDDQWDADGSFVDDALDGLEELFGERWIAVNFISFGVMIAMMFISFSLFQTSRPGMLLGMLVLPFAARLGFLDIVILGVIGFICILYVGHQMFTARAG